MKSTTVNTEIGPERKRLNFAHAVEHQFSFLLAHGFRLEHASPTIVQYGRRDLIISIYHGRKSFELGLEIERSGKTFSISELIRAADPERAKTYRNFAANTHQALIDGLSRLGGLVQEYGKDLLFGSDDALLMRLEDQRKHWAEEYALEVLKQQIRPKADAAFRAHDYSTVVQLLSKIENHIAGSDRKKLDFARRQMSRSVKPV